MLSCLSKFGAFGPLRLLIYGLLAVLATISAHNERHAGSVYHNLWIWGALPKRETTMRFPSVS